MLFPCLQMRLHVTNHIYSKWKEIPVSTSTILVDGPWWVLTVTALVLATNFLSWFWEALSPCPSGQWPANMEPVAEQDLIQMWQSLRRKPSFRNQYPIGIESCWLFSVCDYRLYTLLSQKSRGLPNPACLDGGSGIGTGWDLSNTQLLMYPTLWTIHFSTLRKIKASRLVMLQSCQALLKHDWIASMIALHINLVCLCQYCIQYPLNIYRICDCSSIILI